jgi:hypothetical protein
MAQRVLVLRYRTSRYLSALVCAALSRFALLERVWPSRTFETAAGTGRTGGDRKRSEPTPPKQPLRLRRPDGTKIEPGRVQTARNTG